MNFFCLLWIPLFYLLRRSFMGGAGGGGVWAILFGCITAILQFVMGYLVSPGGFGFSRWLFGFIDIVSLPVLIPIIICLILFLFQGFSGDPDFAGFALLWMIPVAALRAISWSTDHNSILLVAVPLLWTALAVGIPFFITLMMGNFRWGTAGIYILCIIVLSALAAGSYWAFFSQQTLLGYIFLFASHIPFFISLGFDISHA